MHSAKLDVSGSGKFVAGVDFSGSKEVPNETWLAIGNLSSLGVQIVEVKRVGSHGLTGLLSEDPPLIAVGLDFPFSLPMEFAQFITEKRSLKPFQSWQELAECLAFISLEDFQALVEAFNKEPKRYTDKLCKPPAQSPLHRGNPGMVQMTFHGLRLLASLNPAKFFIEPFQKADAKKCRVVEVYPSGTLSSLHLPYRGYKSKEKKDRDEMFATRKSMVRQLMHLRETGDIALKDVPRLSMSAQIESQAISSDDAFDAIVACYTAATLVAAPHYFSDPFESDNLDVLIEGWIFSPNKIWAKDPLKL
jgi:hypothetical protein